MDAKEVLDMLLGHLSDEVTRLRDKGTKQGYHGIVVMNSINRVLGNANAELEERRRQMSPLAYRHKQAIKTISDPKQAAEPQVFGEQTLDEAASLDEVVLNIKSLTEIDLEHKSVFELLASMGEEVGEFSRELKIEERTYGNTYKKHGDESSRDEAVNMIVCALSLYFARNGSIGELSIMINKKLDKWARCQGMADMPGLCPDCGTQMKIIPLGGVIRDLECPKCSPDSFKPICL